MILLGRVAAVQKYAINGMMVEEDGLLALGNFHQQNRLAVLQVRVEHILVMD